ncbi:hypothetical protein VNO80_30447 [Phaseolus coccineus]|uniref:Uncharacterized protein n=1 Tax=Phaseolus coccineus TaxID=3886 RepID=A0AAN9LCR9_PHACN
MTTGARVGPVVRSEVRCYGDDRPNNEGLSLGRLLRTSTPAPQTVEANTTYERKLVEQAAERELDAVRIAQLQQ